MTASKIIWFNKALNLQTLGKLSLQTMATHLGMEWVEVSDNSLKMRMPVDARTHQPYGILHGGASCALAETIGSIGSFLVIDTDRFVSVGLEINANHVRSVRSGWVTATALALHLGKLTHIWDIKIHDEQQRLICVCRLTVAILEKAKAGLEIKDAIVNPLNP